MNTVRSETRAACCMLCVTMMIVDFGAQLVDQLFDLCVLSGSSDAVGSSSSSTVGDVASARAMQSRCCCPPESAMALALEPILHLVPQRRALERALDDARPSRFATGRSAARKR